MTQKALLVIDFINDLAHPKGKLARYADRISENRVIEHANQCIAHARKQNWLIVFVKIGFSSSYAECPKHSPLFGGMQKNQALLLDSWGTNFHEDLALQPEDLIIIKHRVNCFYATPLEAILRAQNINTIFLSGIATNMAVEHTAREAHDRDYSVNIVQNACEALTKEIHDSALNSLSRISNILSTSDL
jgi:nicotinamidase-related amidase